MTFPLRQLVLLACAVVSVRAVSAQGYTPHTDPMALSQHLRLVKCVIAPNARAVMGLVWRGDSQALPMLKQPDEEWRCDPQRAGDRYGRPVVQSFGKDGWTQGNLVASGQALVWSVAGEREGLYELWQLEDEARANKLGMWADDQPQIRFSADDAEQVATDRQGKLTIFVGRVRSVGGGKRVHYLNFGTNWKRDLTVEISRSTAKKVNLDVELFDQACIEVRGFPQPRNGAVIKITRHGQMRDSMDCRDY